MANEIQVNINFRASKSGAEVGTNKRFNDATNGVMIQRTQEIGETYEALDLGDVANPSQLLITNLSTVNGVVLTADVVESPVISIPYGRTAVFRPNSLPLYIKTDNDTASVFFIATEDG